MAELMRIQPTWDLILQTWHMILALIPARGGSKRIPGKNTKPFGGLPMIAHSIRAAHQVGLFDRIMVSTDSDEIMQIARDYGAEAPFRRPAEIANDTASTEDVLVHALRWLSGQGTPAGFFCCIYATAPFVRSADIQKGYELLRAENATTAFPVTTYAYPIFRSLRINSCGRIEMLWPENNDKRSQELPEAYHDAGQFYWGDTQKFLQEPLLFSSNSVPVVVPRHLVQDIDTPEDWAVAEKMFLRLTI